MMAATDMGIGHLASDDSQKMLDHNQVAMSKSSGKSVIVDGSASESLNSDNLNGSNSDPSCHSDADADNALNYDDYDDSDDYMYDDDDDDENDYLSMQAQFDDVDLPPGVEASVSWLKDPVPSVNTQVGPSSLNIYDPTNGENHAAATSSSTVLTGASATGKELDEKEQGVMEDQVLINFQNFKRFDTVDDFSDHHFNGGSSAQPQQPTKTWAKKILEEWKILENDLPDTIYVRVYETRMDLLRAIIVGPAGTPYHDGLFVFDIVFPPAYPDVPPMVYYYSGGLRINPNLYDCGKVCLSLLNTWNGKGNEKWVPKKSTMLQVLVSIQALILNALPYFNEPGYERSKGTAAGKSKSMAYNENVFVLSLKTMIYTLRRPPKHFEDFVAGHFRLQAHNILSACKAYMEGAEIGSVVEGKVLGEAETKHRSEFKEAVAKMMNGLVNHFVRNGSKDCEQFRLPSSS